MKFVKMHSFSEFDQSRSTMLPMRTILNIANLLLYVYSTLKYILMMNKLRARFKKVSNIIDGLVLYCLT